MFETLRLEDLRAKRTEHSKPRGPTAREVFDVEVTPEMLRGLLLNLGAFERQWHEPIALHPKGRPDLGDDLPPGVYIVIGASRLEGEEKCKRRSP